MQRSIILTDALGAKIGVSDVIGAHTGNGKLHKAISVYIFSPSGDSILIQKRSEKKMLWPGIWANTCCSHPFEGESMMEAGKRRLREEMGFVCDLSEGPNYVYRAEDPSGRGVEHEHVTMLIGTIGKETPMHPNRDEVDEWKWITLKTLSDNMKKLPDIYAPWFHLGLPTVLACEPCSHVTIERQ